MEPCIQYAETSGAVNIATRMTGLSAPGEVLVSETVRSLARTSAGVAFEDRGEQALKGVGEAVKGVGGSRGGVMEPQVKYAQTNDGVNIAYYTMGSGPPFVWVIAPMSHLLAERRVPDLRAALGWDGSILHPDKAGPAGVRAVRSRCH